MCTNWLGAVNGNAADIKQRAALKVLGRSPVERQLAFAQERGWAHLDFVQTVGDDYAQDLGVLTRISSTLVFDLLGGLVVGRRVPFGGASFVCLGHVARPRSRTMSS